MEELPIEKGLISFYFKTLFDSELNSLNMPSLIPRRKKVPIKVFGMKFSAFLKLKKCVSGMFPPRDQENSFCTQL